MTLSKPNSLSSLKADDLSGGRTDRRLASLLSLLAGVSASLLVLVLVFLLKEAWPVLSGGGWQAFFRDQGWYPLEGRFGMAPMIWASLAMTMGAVLLALPLGLASAIFLQFHATGLVAWVYRLILSLLAGIPSVVYGLWGLTQLVPLIAQWQPPGASLLF